MDARQSAQLCGAVAHAAWLDGGHGTSLGYCLRGTLPGGHTESRVPVVVIVQGAGAVLAASAALWEPPIALVTMIEPTVTTWIPKPRNPSMSCGHAIFRRSSACSPRGVWLSMSKRVTPWRWSQRCTRQRFIHQVPDRTMWPASLELAGGKPSPHTIRATSPYALQLP
mgnify:CR=1 FL=1